MEHKSNKKGILITLLILVAIVFGIFAYTIYSGLSL